MNFTSLIDYFETLSENHKQILHSDNEKHFFKNDDDIKNGLRSVTKTKAVITGAPEFTIGADNNDANIENNFNSFLILGYVEPGNKDGEFTMYNDCKQIAIDFISKFRNDAYTCTAIKGITITGIRIEPIGPVLDNFYGVVCDLTFQDNINLEYDESKWL